VNTTVGNKPKKMKTLPARRCESRLQNAIPRQLPVRDRLVNSSQILINDPARSEIEMAHLRIAHLALRQPHIQAARTQFSSGITAIKLVVEWSAGQQSRISVLFAPRPAAGIDAPTVADNKHDRTGHIHQSLATITDIDKRFRACGIDNLKPASLHRPS
jgi:hypothetical protein